MPSPGYSIAAFRLRMLGDGFTQGRSVASNQSPRCQSSMGITVRAAPSLRLGVEELGQFAHGHAVAHGQSAEVAHERLVGGIEQRTLPRARR